MFWLLPYTIDANLYNKKRRVVLIAGEPHGKASQSGLVGLQELLRILKLRKIMTNLKKALLFALFLGTLMLYSTSCNKDNAFEDLIEPAQSHQLKSTDQEIIPIGEIDEFILHKIKSSKKPFNWKSASDKMIYSAAMQSDSILSIVYMPEADMTMTDFFSSNKTKAFYKNNKNRLPDELVAKRDEILNRVLEMEREYKQQPKLSLKDILPLGYEKALPHIYIKMSNPAVVSELRRNRFVIRLSPRSHDMSKVTEKVTGRGEYDTDVAFAGCYPESAASIDASDYDADFNSFYNSKASWHYANNGVLNAWDLSQGEGIGVCVIDTGVSEQQDNLNGLFSTGISSGRTLTTASTLKKPCNEITGIGTIAPAIGNIRPAYCPTSPYDECGHGTGMAGLITGPLTNDGNSVGIAYKADLLAIKAVNDVLIYGGNEIDGVANALYMAGDNDEIKIISMSIGRLQDNARIEMAIGYASMTKRKLIFAAAGTGPTTPMDPSVIFPANLPTDYTVGITGVQISPFGITSTCSNCFYGEEVDFVVIMEKERDGENIGPLTLANQSNVPKYTSGSSCSTATAAGIAALVWAAHPNEDKDQIFERLRASTTTGIPIEDPAHGWGVLDAYRAITVW